MVSKNNEILGINKFYPRISTDFHRLKIKITNRKIRVNPCNLWTLFFFLFFLFSCKSTPKQFDALLDHPHLPLDTGAQVYILANVKQASPIIELLPIAELQDRQTKQMLDKTNFAAVALFPRESGRYFQLAAWGKYPNSSAGMALNSNRHWEKHTPESGGSYWYAQVSRMSIAVESKQAFAVSYLTRDRHADPRAKEPGVKIPDGFSDFTHSSPLSLWMNNPEAVIAEMIANAGLPIRIPVRQLFINIYPMPQGECEALIRMIFLNEPSARGAVSMLTLAAGLAQDLPIAPIFLANPPVQNRNIVDIKTARLTEDELKVLLELLF